MLASIAVQAGEPAGNGYRLVRANGCVICHAIESRAAKPYLPPGPAFQDIARRYRSDPDAVRRLTSTVRDGSAPLQRDRHWNARDGFDGVCPGDFMLSEAETQSIVAWILTLDAPNADRAAAHGPRRDR
jgi:cytochrome c